jgi:ubiquinone biosynthesis protein
VKYITRTFRLMRINFVLLRYNLDEIIFLVPWFYPFRFLVFFNPWYWVPRKKLTRGERIRRALEDLGPIFIKAGQVISTRRDILPDDIADELAKLQDRVPPFSGQVAMKLVEKSLGQNIHAVFRDFDVTPLASASIAQVHGVTLLDGRSAVVKVLRPGIRKMLDRDIDLLYFLAGFAHRYSIEGRRFKPKEMVEEVEHTLYDELDLMREGANASQLRRNFQHSDSLYIPEIFWAYCRNDLLVMERIEGIPIHNIAAIKAAGINLKKLAERGIEIFFTQVFRDSFFHADMHPGNIFVSTKNLENPQYIAVDFGIVGSLNTKDQRYLAENMLAFFKRDYQRVAELHIASGWLPPDTRVDQFEGAIRAVCEPIFERPLKDISFGQLLLRLFQAARRFNINIQPQLVLLQKTLLNIEGVGRQLDPDLDLWTTAAPFLERWLKKQLGVKAFIRRVRDNVPFWSEKLPEVPGLIFDVLLEHKNNQEVMRFERLQAEQNQVHKSKRSKRHLLLGLSSGFLISGVVLFCEGVIAVNPWIFVGIAAVSWVFAELV